MVNKEDKTPRLSPFCKDRSSFKTKVALLSFYKITYSQWTEIIILIIEYLQIMSQIILSPSSDFDSPGYESFFFEVIVYFFKLINPSYLLAYEESNETTSAVLMILLLFSILKLSLFGYIVCISVWNYKENSWLACIWRWVFKFQTRVTYFLLTSFWVKTIIEVQRNNFSIFGMSSSSSILLSTLVLAIEFLFCFVIETQLSYVLPTENLLSSINNELQMTTLFQKLTIQVLNIIFHENSLTNPWVTSIIGLIFSGIREIQFLTKLPLYHFKALALQRALLSLVMSLNLTYFFSTILKATSYEEANINFVVLTWILLSFLSVKGTHESLKAQVLRLICTKTKSSPEILLNKAYLTEELKLNEIKTGQGSSKYHWTHLIAMHQRTEISNIFHIDAVPKSMSPEDEMLKIFLLYFEKLLVIFPKSFLINLHTAYMCFRSSESYSKTVKIAGRLNENKWWSPNYLSSSLLFHKIENSMLRTNKNDNDLDLTSYIQSKLFVEAIKRKMLKQTDLYLKVCGNILGDTANIEEIFTSAQMMSELKVQIQKKINSSGTALPSHYISPLLCYAKYYSVVNHSPEDFERYFQSYNQGYFKFEKKFKETKFLEENLYQDCNAFLVISTEKADYGKILYCNSALVSLCGGANIKSYIGSRVPRIFAHSLQPYFEAFGAELLKADSEVAINNTFRAYLYHKDHYLVEVDFHVKFHPYLAQGLCTDMIIRPVPVTAEFLLLREDGAIEGASKLLSQGLRLNGGGGALNIPAKCLSRELEKVNTAFNIVRGNADIMTQKENKSLTMNSTGSMTMSYAKAFKLYTKYTEGFQKIQLYPYENQNLLVGSSLRNRGETQTFYCHVVVEKFGGQTMKVVYLRPTIPDSTMANIQSRMLGLESKRLTQAEEEEEEGNSSTRRSSVKEPVPQTLDAEDFRLEEQEEEGDLASENVNFEGQQSHAQQIIQFSPHNRVTSDPDTPLSPFTPLSDTQRFLLTSSARKTTAENQLAFTSNSPDQPPRVKTLLSLSENQGNHEAKLQKRQSKVRDLKYQASQHSSQRSAETASDRAFKKAIVTRSYPRSFIILCIVFYGTVLLTFLAQILMKSVSDSTMENLQIKKNLLKLSQVRSYNAALIYNNAVGTSLQLLGALQVQSGGSLVGINQTISNFMLRMKNMKTANDEMIQNVYALDREFQSLLFVQDVDMNGTYLDNSNTSIQKVTTFQATQELTNAVKTFGALPNPSSLVGYNLMQYLTLNIPDDFQYKNVQITDIFISSVNKQKAAYQKIINLCLILSPFLLLSIGLLLMVIIWNQYKIEQKNMKNFIKISPTGVKDVFDQLIKFKKSLINDESFESKWLSSMSEDFEFWSDHDQASTYSKKHNTQIIRHQEFLKRYLKYILRVVVYLAILIAITIWDLISTHEAIDVIYNRQSQLQFANYISNRAQSAYTAFSGVYTSNNTLLVEHQLPLDALADGLTAIQTIGTEIPTRFQEVDGSYNPEVETRIFDNDPECKTYTADVLIHCKYLLSQGQPVNLMITNSALLSLLKAKYQKYLSIKTSVNAGGLLAVAFDGVNLILSNFVSTAYQAQKIADIMDRTLTEKISENRQARNTIMLVFTVCLVVISVVIWIDILRVIRDVYNDFKKVLQIFPPKLVLSSYLLKNFLRKTTNQPILSSR